MSNFLMFEYDAIRRWGIDSTRGEIILTLGGYIVASWLIESEEDEYRLFDDHDASDNVQSFIADKVGELFVREGT